MGPSVLQRTLAAFAFSLLVSAACAEPTDAQAGVTLGANEQLAAGATAIRRGDFDAGIRLTRRGLDAGSLPTAQRAAGEANLCAAYVSKEQPDEAIPHCDTALALDGRNWRAYTVRARAWLLKGKYARARLDNDAAAAINPDAEHVRMITGVLNEIEYTPRVVIEEHQ